MPNVSSWDEALELVDGKKVVLDGIEGIIKVRKTPKSPYYGYSTTSVSHVPTAKGMKSAKYIQTKRKLGDDWSTDLSDSETLPALMQKLGIVLV